MKKQKLELENAVANSAACSLCVLCGIDSFLIPDTEFFALTGLFSGE